MRGRPCRCCPPRTRAAGSVCWCRLRHKCRLAQALQPAYARPCAAGGRAIGWWLCQARAVQGRAVELALAGCLRAARAAAVPLPFCWPGAARRRCEWGRGCLAARRLARRSGRVRRRELRFTQRPWPLRVRVVPAVRTCMHERRRVRDVIVICITACYDRYRGPCPGVNHIWLATITY